MQVRATAWRAFAQIADVFPALLARPSGQEAFASAFSAQEKSALVCHYLQSACRWLRIQRLAQGDRMAFLG